MVRVGAVEVADPSAVLRARAKEGPVAAAIDPDATFAAVQALVAQAMACDVKSLELASGTTKVTLRFGARPVRPPSTGPNVTPLPADFSRSAGDATLSSRPARLELHVRIRGESDVDENLAACVSECLAPIREHAVTVSVAAPRGAAWGRIAAVIARVNEAAAERAVRHELAPE